MHSGEANLYHRSGDARTQVYNYLDMYRYVLYGTYSAHLRRTVRSVRNAEQSPDRSG